MGFFDGIFGFNNDRKQEKYDSFEDLQRMASSRQEAFDLTGDDTYYMGSDSLDNEEEDEEIEELEDAGLDYDDLEMMDEDERREAIEDAGLDPDDYDF